ncbi:MAG: hypothetical protein Q7R79_01845 [bacterium]|nr:hypothetical protein [bacterium]
MKKIFLYHLAAFFVGALVIAAYFFQKISSLDGADGFAAIVLVPIAVVYVAAFGVFCIISCVLWLGIAYIKNRKNKTKKS